jgi:hypothetical protein
MSPSPRSASIGNTLLTLSNPRYINVIFHQYKTSRRINIFNIRDFLNTLISHFFMAFDKIGALQKHPLFPAPPLFFLSYCSYTQARLTFPNDYLAPDAYIS